MALHQLMISPVFSHRQRKGFRFCRPSVVLRMSTRGCVSSVRCSHAYVFVSADDGLHVYHPDCVKTRVQEILIYRRRACVFIALELQPNEQTG